MNIKEAAEYLGISIKTLERKIAGGEIAVAYVPGATGKQRTFDRTELDRFKQAEADKAAATSYVARPRVAAVRSSAPSPLQALERAAGEQGIAMLASVLEDALRAAQAPKMLLTLQDAADQSGLSASHLLNAIHAKQLDGRKIGRGFKVRPADLHEYAKRVWSDAPKYEKPEANDRDGKPPG